MDTCTRTTSNLQVPPTNDCDEFGLATGGNARLTKLQDGWRASLGSPNGFLGTLPSNGRYVLQHLRPNGSSRLQFFPDKSSLIETAHDFRVNAFHAVHGFGDDDTRSSKNALWFRSFIFDVDASEGTGKPDSTKFATKEEALRHVITTLQSQRFPQPNHIIESSAGFHLYWKLDEDMSAEEYRPLARRFRSFLHRTMGKAAADLARVADLASVLRPPLTIHKKPGRKPFLIVEKYKALPMPKALFIGALDRVQPHDGSSRAAAPSMMLPRPTIPDHLKPHLLKPGERCTFGFIPYTDRLTGRRNLAALEALLSPLLIGHETFDPTTRKGCFAFAQVIASEITKEGMPEKLGRSLFHRFCELDPRCGGNGGVEGEKSYEPEDNDKLFNDALDWVQRNH